LGKFFPKLNTVVCIGDGDGEVGEENFVFFATGLITGG
jgi:hypothetical protein